MDERVESPSRSTENLNIAQTHQTNAGTRQTVGNWLTTIAGYVRGPKKQQFDDAGFHRGRAWEYPIIPGEENRNRDLGQLQRERWLPDASMHFSPLPSMHVSPALSVHSVVAERWLRGDVSPEPSMHVSPAPSMHSAANRDKVDREASNVPEAPTSVMPPAALRVMNAESLTAPEMKEGPQRGSEQSSRAQSSDLHTIPAQIPTGTYESLTVTIRLTVAMRQ